MNKKIVSLLIAAGLTASQAFAAPINATIADWNAGLNSFGGGPYGAGNEDNETELGTIASQIWDMEAFVVNGSTLYIVGGYNMQAGAAGSGGSTIPNMLTPGDLFIKVGGGNPPPSPLGVGSGMVNNAVYGYSYAIDLTQPVGATGSSATAYALNASSMFNTVVYDQFGANPWKYASGGSSLGSTSIAYASGLSGAAVDSALGTSLNLQGGLHNILAVDLSFLSVAAGTQVYFSYTMECGNDSLKGQYGGGFDRVPDGGASALLIGLGLAVMSVVGLRRRS
jgi:hypothetical protein